MSEDEIQNAETACDCSPAVYVAPTPSKDEVREAIVAAKGNKTRAAYALGFCSCWAFYDYLDEKGWSAEMNKSKNPNLARAIAERYEEIGVENLIRIAKSDNFAAALGAAKKLLDDQCAEMGWGSAEKETAAVTGTGKSFAEIVAAESEEKQEEK